MPPKNAQKKFVAYECQTPKIIRPTLRHQKIILPRPTPKRPIFWLEHLTDNNGIARAALTFREVNDA
ncbi:MAG: hypothetical protein LBJ59_12515 [Zoogloeaceae bacterium]|jgi:hypothetical protein|nr:hypothetical protein [Zoogloeaceae bacterium]